MAGGIVERYDSLLVFIDKAVEEGVHRAAGAAHPPGGAHARQHKIAPESHPHGLRYIAGAWLAGNG
ncbi:hypothetical protein TRIUR3_03261 [Triticum urartu]|uniref:Uncharacterized protein n=1 Tax=Triticum urartu TaxID=4572 RepID=M7Z954_TRIUA|nr:hypothetical protein TRIUR3_03261 [Triticum urartu]